MDRATSVAPTVKAQPLQEFVTGEVKELYRSAFCLAPKDTAHFSACRGRVVAASPASPILISLQQTDAFNGNAHAQISVVR